MAVDIKKRENHGKNVNLLSNKRVKDAPKGGLRRQKLNLETRKEMLGHLLS